MMGTAPGRRTLLHDVVPVAVLAVLTTTLLAQSQDGESGPGDIVLSVSLWGPALLRRRYSLLALAGTALLVLVHWAPSGFDAVDLLPADIALLVVLAAVTERCSTGWAIAGSAVVEGFALATLIGTTAAPEGHPVVPLTAFTVAAALFGRNRRARAAVLAGLRDRLEQAEHERDQQARIAVAEERTRIAREVHDVISHSISVMTALADGASYALRSGRGEQQAGDAVAAIASTGREALTEVHRLLGVLRLDNDRDDPGLSRRPAPGLSDLSGLVEQVRNAGLPTTLKVTGRPAPLSTAAQLVIYRVVQESLTNALKHAPHASRARVELAWATDELVVIVQDDGHSAPPPSIRVGHGLVGMRERMGAQNGSFSAGPGPGGGWRVTASLPLHDESVSA